LSDPVYARPFQRLPPEPAHVFEAELRYYLPMPRQTYTGPLPTIGCTRDDRWRPFFLVAIFTGLRSSELRGLRWAEIDLKKAELHVRQRDACHPSQILKSRR
jgi:integrase